MLFAKSKRFPAILALVLALVLTLTACSGGASKPSDAPAPSDSSASSDNTTQPAGDGDIVITSTEKVTLQLSTTLASTHNLVSIMTKEFAENVNKFTNGNVTVNIASDGQLFTTDGAADALSSGGLDLHTGSVAWLMGYDPVLQYAGFAFGATSIDQWKASIDVIEPITEKVLADYGIVNLCLYPYSATVWGTNKPIRLPEDMKGMNMRSAGPVWASVYSDVGATGTALASADTYDAMDKGTIDGYFTGFNSIMARGLDAVTKYVVGIIEIPYYGIQMSQIMWDSLPADYQAAIQKAADIAAETGYELYLKDAEDEARLEEEGVEVYFWTEEEAAIWKEAVRPTVQNWLDSCIAAGREEECRAILAVNFGWEE